MKRNFLLSTFLSTVILSSSLFSQNITCVGGHCKVDLKKLFPSKNIAVKVTHLQASPSSQPITYIIANNVDQSNNDVNPDLIALDSSKYLMQEHETVVLEENEDVIVLAHAKYIAQENERLEEMQEEPSIIAEPVERIEHRILNKSLPESSYYCANEKKIIYHAESNSYECA
jgi:hypothetical protein